MAYTARNVLFGHDVSGTEANLTAANSPMLNADVGCYYYAEDTGRLWWCTGQGVWTCVGFGGLGAPGGAGSYTPLLKLLIGMTDATGKNLAVITVPNVLAVGGIAMTVLAGLGDGDSAEQSYWTLAVSRIAGANALIAVSTKANAVHTTGATANAAATIASGSVSGGVTAVNTFQLTGAVARSAGSSTGHTMLVAFEIMNNVTGGITVA